MKSVKKTAKKSTKTAAKKVSKKTTAKKAVKAIKKVSKPITVQRSDTKDPTVMEDTSTIAPPVSPVVNDGMVVMVPVVDNTDISK